MARAESKTARGNEPSMPCVEVHGDGTQIVRHHKGLSIFEHTVIEMAKSIVASDVGLGLSFSDIADRAVSQAEAILSRLEIES